MLKSKFAWIVVGVIVLFGAVQWSRRDYLEWSSQRADWHTRCDRYVGQSTQDDEAAKCRRELGELLVQAKLKGWSN